MSFFKKLAGTGKTLLKKVSGGVDTTLRNVGKGNDCYCSVCKSVMLVMLVILAIWGRKGYGGGFG